MTRKDRNLSKVIASEAGYRPLQRNNQKKAGVGLNIAVH